MARLDIDTGTEGNSATGDTLRTAFTKANTNFIDLYTSIGADNVVINTNTILIDNKNKIINYKKEQMERKNQIEAFEKDNKLDHLFCPLSYRLFMEKVVL